ncbi:coiled-coil domain-containing protein 167 isoform X3 [Dermochelys coriacea]|uniref:coiled-coil domain-containing protein 167 isoform X3 n=1 Tax=Dermochelys coriacea TaxID=27794 RepID=UPI001CA892A9|nr:coiled-coil domain-containing protein 167 isoform X3 [Dermochelys coriacea]
MRSFVAKRREMVKKREGLSVAQEVTGLPLLPRDSWERGHGGTGQEIDCLEEKLSLCRQSMEEVDLKLRREELSPEGRKSLERERSLLLTKAETYASGSACSTLCRDVGIAEQRCCGCVSQRPPFLVPPWGRGISR